jgi:CDP-2,3-bis-(O-geranylgeranyl)-sn-glycerol synthase
MAKLVGYDVLGLAILCAMVANGSAALVSRGTPLDRDARFVDGRPILGRGKTVEGLITAITYSTSVGLALIIVLRGEVIASYLVVIMASALAAMLGDIAASFVKRRVGLPRGEHLPIIDQLDFYAGVLVALYILGYAIDPLTIVLLGVLLYGLHRATNLMAFKLGIKDKPW